MRQYDAVLLIDAIDAALPAGTLKIFELGDISYSPKESGTSTHELDLRSIFELYVKFNLKAKIYVAGIQVEDTSWAEGLSQTLQKKKNEIIKQVSRFIDKTFNL
jgi:hydrogenase maturation protease